MPAHYSVTEPIQPTGSIVDRAAAILNEHRAARDPRSVAPALDEVPAALVAEFEKRLGHLREQAQDLVDQLASIVERVPAAALSGAPNPALDSIPSPPEVGPTSVPVLRTARASSGGVAKTVLGLINETGAPASVVLRATSLVNELGDEIPGKLVSFAPNPLNLPAGGELPIQANVQVPPGTRPGTYTGLVRAVGLEATRAVMTVDVSPARGG